MENDIVKEAVRLHNAAQTLDNTVVELFNSTISHKCTYNEYQEPLDPFMNGECNHPKGDGHCCIALCPLEEEI